MNKYVIKVVGGEYDGKYVNNDNGISENIIYARKYTLQQAIEQCNNWNKICKCEEFYFPEKVENKLESTYWQNMISSLWTTLSGTPEDKIYIIAVWLVDFLKDMEYIDPWDNDTICGIKDAVKQIVKELELPQ